MNAYRCAICLFIPKGILFVLGVQRGEIYPLSSDYHNFIYNKKRYRNRNVLNNSSFFHGRVILKDQLGYLHKRIKQPLPIENPL